MKTLAEIAPSTEVLSTETLEADSRSLMQSRSARFNWNFGFWIAAFHIGAIAAFFFFSWSAVAVAAVLWVLGQNVGIGMSYHRLLTHRGYTTPIWVEYMMAVCSPIAPAIRTRRATVNGGPTPAGFFRARCATAMPC
jgi:fatty-acid desaturase